MGGLASAHLLVTNQCQTTGGLLHTEPCSNQRHLTLDQVQAMSQARSFRTNLHQGLGTSCKPAGPEVLISVVAHNHPTAILGDTDSSTSHGMNNL